MVPTEKRLVMPLLTLLGVLGMMLSAWLVWIEAPISGGVQSGVRVAWLVPLLGALGGIAWYLRCRRLSAVCAVTGLGLCSFALLYLTLVDATFWSLVDEHAQYGASMRFSRQYLPPNNGIEPISRAHLATETLLERLATATTFMGQGWWLGSLGSLALLLPCLTGRDAQTMRWLVLSAIVLYTGQGVLLGRGVAAQYLQDMGDRDLAGGRYAAAVQHYKAAQRFDVQLRRSERVHLRLGEAYYKRGRLSQPHGRLYLGHRDAQRGDLEAAIAAYALAAQAPSDPLQEMIHKRMAWTYVHMGMAAYRQRSVGRAITLWERALAIDAAQLQAAYFLTKAYFDLGQYERSIAIGHFWLARSQNRLLNANAQANMGDSYWKRHDFAQARQAYKASMRLDAHRNFRIFKSLAGT